MNFLNKDKDNILSIVKTLRPINYLYSKQNKDFDRHFRSSSLKGLIKKINSHPKFNEFLKPGESLDEFHNKNKTAMNVNFKGTFNYVEELSNLKSLPMFLLNKKFNKRGKFNIDYINNSFNNKKNKEGKKKNKIQEILHLKNTGDADVTLDPGRYHPNYNYIRRRYPCAYLGKPKSQKETFQKDNQDIEEEKKTNTHKSANLTKNAKTRNNKLTDLYETSSNQTILLKTKNNKKKKMNFSSSNFYSMPKSISINNNNENKINVIGKNKIKLINKFNGHNTVSSWSHTMDLDRPKKFRDKIKIINDNSKTYNNYFGSSTNFDKTDKKKYHKNSSAANLRCPVIFDKMPGRDRPINFVDGGWKGCRTNYNPDYNVIRPHIPSTIFKSKRQYQNFKKYITGKIIRSYCYNPEQYFVFEIKKNKVSGKYETIILKS